MAAGRNQQTKQEQVLKSERRRYRAMVEGDLLALEVLADSLTYTHTTGRQDTKEEFL